MQGRGEQVTIFQFSEFDLAFLILGFTMGGFQEKKQKKGQQCWHEERGLFAHEEDEGREKGWELKGERVGV